MAKPDPATPLDASSAGTTPADSARASDPGPETGWADDDFAEDAGGAEGSHEDDGYDDGEPVETVDELGRRHVHRSAPEGTNELLEKEAPKHSGLPDSAERWRVRSATGTVLTAFAFGLQQVFEPDRNQPAIVMETSGEPPKDLPVEAQLEQLGPRQSSITVRSWLLGNKPSQSAPMAPQAGDDDASGGNGGTTPGRAGD